MADNVGGYYEYSFVINNLEGFTCTICKRVPKDPHQTGCCGESICASCITNWYSEPTSDSCPNCQKKFDTGFLDRRLKREIESLNIYCTNKEKGCQWTGGIKGLKAHLDSHTDNCVYVEVECPNKCMNMTSLKFERVMKKDLSYHLENDCHHRPYQCEHCGYQDTYLAITGTHYEECPVVPLKCPNGCSKEDIKRKDMEVHRNQCPDEKIECPYGCRALDTSKSWLSKLSSLGKNTPYQRTVPFTVKKKDLDEHLENDCELRPYKCKHCGLESIFTIITVKHYGVCSVFPLNCPNNCGVRNIKRKDMQEHREQCPKEPVQCPFEEAGCKENLVQCQLEQHMSANQQQHLLLVMCELKATKEELKKVNSNR